MSTRAGVRRRLAASCYEALLLLALALLTGFVTLPLISPGSPPAGARFPLPGPTAQAASLVSLVVVLGAYCVWFWSGGRRSLPMKTWRIAMEPAHGSHVVGVTQAAIRYAAWWIGPALAIATYAALRPLGHGRWALTLLAVNYGWALFDRDRQFLHDRIARTRLVLAGSQ